MFNVAFNMESGAVASPPGHDRPIFDIVDK
jgi:hypothetical protein